MREEFADRTEGAGVGRGIGARGAADRRLVDDHEAVDLSGAKNGIVRAGRVLGPVEVAGQGGAEDVVDQGRFAAAGDAGDADEGAERKMCVDILQVVFARPGHAEPAVGCAGHEGPGGEGLVALGWHTDAEFSAQVTPGQRLRGGGYFFEGALGDDLSTERSGPRADVDDVVRRGNGVVVVLDDQDRVAEVAEAFEGGDEALVVALVKSDAGFVENIKDAGQAAADLRGEADALGFAAGQGAAFASQREVVEADFFEKGEAAGDFGHDFTGDRFILALQAELSDDLRCAGDGQIAEGIDGIFLSGRSDQRDAENFGAETGTAAAGAGAAVLQGFEALLEGFAFGPGQQMLELREQAFEGLGHFVARRPGAELEVEGAVAGTVEEEFAEGGRQFAQGQVGAHAGIGRQGSGQGRVVGLHFRGALAPGHDGAVVEGLVLIKDEVRIEVGFGPQPLASRAGSEVAVEREMLRGQARQSEPGARIAKGGGKRMVGEFLFVRRLDRGHELSFAPAQSGFDRIGEALTEPGFEHEPVDDGFDLMAAFFVQADARIPAEVGDFAVDACADEALAAEFFDDVAVLSYLVAHDRGEEDEFALRWESEDGVSDFLRSLPADQFSRLRIVRHAEGGVEDAEVVVDFRGGCDGRTRAGRGGALFDGDGRGESFDEVHVGTLEAVEKLAGVGREALHVFALPLGIEGVEGE